MSKQARKEGQAYRREARMKLAGFNAKLTDKLKVLNDVLKPRPKYFPQKWWAFLAGIFIDVEKFRKHFE